MIDVSKGRYWDAAWNPVTGCTPAGAACDRCWARAMVERFPTLHGLRAADCYALDGDVEPIPFSEPQYHPERLGEPGRRRKPTVYATCWLGDLFHEKVPIRWIGDVLSAAGGTQHTFLFLTKRPAPMAALALEIGEGKAWWGASAWDQASVDHALDSLEELGAKTWLSLEPLLAPMVLHDIARVGAVVLGAETGFRARPMYPAWARMVRNQCADSGVPFFLKSMGPRKGRHLDGRTHDDLPWRPSLKTDLARERAAATGGVDEGED